MSILSEHRSLMRWPGLLQSSVSNCRAEAFQLPKKSLVLSPYAGLLRASSGTTEWMHSQGTRDMPGTEAGGCVEKKQLSVRGLGRA